jgi:formate--tetrahydrofolate ligase
MPNLVQTTEGAPALIHAGPFANIAHGTSSVLAQRMGIQLADYVVNECGFGADLGAEKYFDLVMPAAGIEPGLAVLIASVRALCTQGAANPEGPFDLGSLRAGLANLDRHLANLEKFGVPVIVAVNRFPSDAEALLGEIEAACRARGVECAITSAYESGGRGALELAEKSVALLGRTAARRPRALYESSLSLPRKVETVAREIYGAGRVYIESDATRKLERFARMGFAHLPVCIAKTQSSFTDKPNVYGAPEGWTFTVTDAILSAGAGWVVIVAGNMMRMPGLGKSPQAFHLDVDAAGNITGLR